MLEKYQLEALDEVVIVWEELKKEYREGSLEHRLKGVNMLELLMGEANYTEYKEIIDERDYIVRAKSPSVPEELPPLLTISQLLAAETVEIQLQQAEVILEYIKLLFEVEVNSTNIKESERKQARLDNVLYNVRNHITRLIKYGNSAF